VAGILAMCVAHGVSAGQTPGDEEKPVAVFHSYTNLIQVPVLVLSPSHQAVAAISEKKFGVTLNNGPVFPATHVRRQGDDPISLSILIDLTGSAGELMPQIHDGLRSLVPGNLHASDHVSVYVLGCSLVRFADDVPAVGVLFSHGVDEALDKWQSEKSQLAKKCKPQANLWDAIGFMEKQMTTLPGRRVMLVLSDGHDKGSKRTWNQIRLFGAWSSVAIFGMIPERNGLGISNGFVDEAYLTVDASSDRANQIMERASREDVFQLACELTGGVVLLAHKGKVGEDLSRFVSMVRGRYIVEFPRTDDAAAGPMAFGVRIKTGDLFIRPSGKSVPLPDPEELADPSRQAIDPSKAPQLGDRKILTVKPEE
jgi:hypothetical protein